MVGRCSKGRRRRLINNAKHVANREQRSPSLRLPTPAPSSDDGPERVDADSTTNGSNIITQNGTAVQTPAGGTLANDLLSRSPLLRRWGRGSLTRMLMLETFPATIQSTSKTLSTTLALHAMQALCLTRAIAMDLSCL
jgi:hypothetical protein